MPVTKRVSGQASVDGSTGPSGLAVEIASAPALDPLVTDKPAPVVPAPAPVVEVPSQPFQSARSMGMQMGGTAVGVYEVVNSGVKFTQDMFTGMPDSTWPFMTNVLIFILSGGVIALIHQWQQD